MRVHEHAITAEARANPYTMACKSITTLTVVTEEKPSVRWREMLNDARLVIRRNWRKGKRAQCGVEAGVAMWRYERLCDVVCLFLGHGSAKLDKNSYGLIGDDDLFKA